MKKSLFALYAFLCLSGASITITGQKNYTPENTEFIFDIDDVILHKTMSGGQIAKNVWKVLSFKIVHKAGGPAIKKLMKSGKGSLEGWIDFFEAKKIIPLVKVLEKIALSKELIPGTKKIVEELHVVGYTLRYGTNAGLREMIIQRKRFASFFDMFENGKSVDFKSQKNIVKKPSQQYFSELLRDCCTANKPHKIFIDDKLKNVEAARKAGMIGIHFKNPQQLRTELKNMGIMFSAPVHIHTPVGA